MTQENSGTAVVSEVLQDDIPSFVSVLDSDMFFIGKLVTHLASNGIKSQIISLEKFPVSKKDILLENRDGNDGWQKEDLFLCDLMIWLRDEGLIRFQEKTSGAKGNAVFEGVQLTSKALIALRHRDFPEIKLGEQTNEAFNRSRHIEIGEFLGAFSGSFLSAAANAYGNS